MDEFIKFNAIHLYFRTMYLLGYIPKDNRLYLGDKDLNVVSYSLLLSVLEYQTAVMREDFETAKQVMYFHCWFAIQKTNTYYRTLT